MIQHAIIRKFARYVHEAYSYLIIESNTSQPNSNIARSLKHIKESPYHYDTSESYAPAQSICHVTAVAVSKRFPTSWVSHVQALQLCYPLNLQATVLIVRHLPGPVRPERHDFANLW